MIGNDIIDLDLARKQSNWKRKGILNKLFTPLEQQSIHSADNPELQFWNLWSRKEAVYKIYNRETKIRGFIPMQLQCSDLNSDGIVEIAGKTYFTRTEITADYIHTTAVVQLQDFEKIDVIHAESIAKADDGIPYCTLNNSPVSISHHGRFERKIILKS